VNISGQIRVMHVIDKLGVAGSSIHGVTRAISWWIPRFDPDQFQFVVCSLRSEETAGDIFKKERIPLFYLNKGKFDPTTLTKLLSLIRQTQPHILHLHGYGSTNFGRIASVITGIPNIVHEHTILKQPFYQTIVDKILSSSTTRSIAISEPVRQFMIRQRKIPESRLETFFYGLPLNEFKITSIKSIKNKRAQLHIGPREKVICCVGRLDRQKGQIYLLKAAAQIFRVCPNTRILIIGDGPDLTILQSTARQEGIIDRVIFTGFREDIADLLALSDIVAIPSLWEGGPITLFEAMNLKKPVIGTPVGLMEEVIKDRETGFLVPCQQVGPLAEKLIFLLENQQIAQVMGQRGYEICQTYDLSYSVDRLSQIYSDLIT